MTGGAIVQEISSRPYSTFNKKTVEIARLC